MDLLDATTIAAWWGAIVATAVLAWDFYKWTRKGPIIRLEVQPNMVLGPTEALDPGDPRGTLVVVTARNVGDAPTTIENVTLVYYNKGSRRGRPTRQMIVNSHPIEGRALPHFLEPGRRWMGALTQSAEIEDMARSGRLIVQVSTANRDRPYKARVRIPT